MITTIDRLNLNPDQMSSYKRIQLLKILDLISLGHFIEAQETVSSLKTEKAIRLQLFGLIASGLLESDPSRGINLLDRVVQEASGCWLKTDQLRVMGFIMECLAAAKMRNWAKELRKKTMAIAESLLEPATRDRIPFNEIVEVYSNFGANLFRAGFSKEAHRLFQWTICVSMQLGANDSKDYFQKMAAISYISRKMAEVGMFRPALRLTRQILSKVFNGLEYNNYELSRVETLCFIAYQMTLRGRRHPSKRVLNQAAKIVIADKHDYDQLRTERLLQISAAMKTSGYDRNARKIELSARRLIQGSGWSPSPAR